MIGRAGVLSSGLRKVPEKNRLRVYYEEVSQNPQKRIKHTKYPFGMWFIGLFCLAFGIAMIWHIAFNVEATLFSSFRRGTWWQYLISIGVTVLGLIFLLAATKKEMELNREKDMIRLSKTNIICLRRTSEIKKLSEVINVQIIRKGIVSPANNTVHFKLMVYFLSGRPLCLYESSDRMKIKKKYIDVATYVGLSVNIENVNILDYATKPHSKDSETVNLELDRI